MRSTFPPPHPRFTLWEGLAYRASIAVAATLLDWHRCRPAPPLSVVTIQRRGREQIGHPYEEGQHMTVFFRTLGNFPPAPPAEKVVKRRYHVRVNGVDRAPLEGPIEDETFKITGFLVGSTVEYRLTHVDDHGNESDVALSPVLTEVITDDVPPSEPGSFAILAHGQEEGESPDPAPTGEPGEPLPDQPLPEELPPQRSL